MKFISAPVLAFLAAFGPSSISAQQRITTQQFKSGLESGAYDIVLDVRTPAERANGFIPGTIHVPIEGFEENIFFETISTMMSSCKKECATIVAHCSIGGRAEAAIESLINLGFEGTLINGLGTDQWVEAGFALTTNEDDAVTEPICATTDICPDTMDSMNGDSMSDMGSMEDSMSDMNGEGSMEETETDESESMESGVASLNGFGAVLAVASLFAVA